MRQHYPIMPVAPALGDEQSKTQDAHFVMMKRLINICHILGVSASVAVILVL